jgi:hypothetical protein
MKGLERRVGIEFRHPFAASFGVTAATVNQIPLSSTEKGA